MATNPMTRGGFSKLMFPGLNKIYLMTLDSYPEEFSKYYNMQTSTMKQEEDVVVDGFGLIPEKTEGAEPTFDYIKLSNSVTYTHKTYVLGYEVTQELFEDEQYGIIRKATQMLAVAVRQTTDTLGASVLNNAFATTIYLGVDGKGLCATDHPQSKAGGTNANRPATDVDFDASSLTSALQTIETWTDANGLPMLKRPKYVVSGPLQRDIMTKVLGTDKITGSNDNDINAIKEWELEKMILHYLSDTDAWFILTKPMDHYINWFWRVKPTFRNYDDPSSGNARFLTRFRCSYGFTTWQGVYGSTGI
jgi:hypothetical protein